MSKSIVSKVIVWSPPVLWMVLLFYLSSLEISTDLAIGGLDKLVHTILYFVLGASFAWSRWKTGSKVPGFMLVLVGIIYGYLDEWHQSFVPGRFPSWGDGLADVIGLVLGFYFLEKLLSRPVALGKGFKK